MHRSLCSEAGRAGSLVAGGGYEEYCLDFLFGIGREKVLDGGVNISEGGVEFELLVLMFMVVVVVVVV